jgi:hypothetical protein
MSRLAGVRGGLWLPAPALREHAIQSAVLQRVRQRPFDGDGRIPILPPCDDADGPLADVETPPVKRVTG